VIQTPYGSAQALVRPENLPPEQAAQAKVVDLADHVAVWGPLLHNGGEQPGRDAGEKEQARAFSERRSAAASGSSTRHRR